LSSSPSPFKLDVVVLLEREHLCLSLSLSLSLQIFFWRPVRIRTIREILCGRRSPLSTPFFGGRGILKKKVDDDVSNES